MEAKLFQIDGTEQHIYPQNGKAFSIGELRRLIGGEIYMRILEGTTLIFVLENPVFHNALINYQASKILREKGLLEEEDFVKGKIVFVHKDLVE